MPYVTFVIICPAHWSTNLHSGPTASFGKGRLQRSGRCHESEIISAFRKSSAKYRTEEQLEDRFIRDMMRNFAPGSSITSQGYVKGLSLLKRTDPFTGAQSGSAKAGTGRS